MRPSVSRTKRIEWSDVRICDWFAGLGSVLVVYLLILFLWVTSAFKITKFNIVNLFSFNIPFLLLRTIPESGFLVFGFDQIVLSVATGTLFGSYYFQDHRAAECRV